MTYELTHGDLIGRLERAELRVDDPRVSEAHAMISLRGGELRMLGLRGRLSLGRGPLSEVPLETGQRILLARRLALHVERVVLPAQVLALEGDGIARQVLTGTHSLMPGDAPSLVRGVHRDAAAFIWSSGDGWRIQIGDAPPGDLQPGESYMCQGVVIRTVVQAVSSAGPGATWQKGGVRAPLRITARFNTVHIQRVGDPVLTLNGLAARIISELVALGGPVAWEILAGEIWGDETRRDRLRSRLDVALSRTRRKLRAARIRADLIQFSSTGYVELRMDRDDVVIDET